MLKKLRIFLAVISIVAITFLFLDISGSASRYLGWLAEIQFLPAVLALNVTVVVALIVLTLLLGRLYCSVICPMGIFQDVISRIRSRFSRNRFGYKPAARWTRLTIMLLFIICAVLGINTVVGLLAPYSAYGRMVTSLGQPVWIWGNNLLASWAEACDSYMFSSHELWLRSLPTLVVAVVTLLAVGITAWRSGRGYCNTVCPVGTLLGYLSKWAIFRPVIDTSKCNSCGLCARNCKSHCINPKEHSVDMTRCVACFDCISRCRQGAISYRPVWKKPSAEHKSETVDNEGRRSFLTITGLAATSIAANAVQKKVDGGLAVIEDRTPPSRMTRLVPAGSLSLKNMDQRCTGCQLCISKCPNNVLRPSTSLSDMLQPTMEFDRGYCRPGCTVCSQVCPTGAITEICCKKKTSISIGYAVWVEKNCVVATDGVECGNCQRHCPTGAIMMVESQKYDGRKIPVINTDKCIGCGACEYLCPARPLGAIYVEGREVHTSR